MTLTLRTVTQEDNTVTYEILDDGEFLVAIDPADIGNLLNILSGTKEGQEWLQDRDEAPAPVEVPFEAKASERYLELLACWRYAGQGGLVEGHCSIIDSNTTWEGLRWTETHQNGDTMTLGTMTIPLSTQFLVCSKHTPKDAG